MAWPHWPGIYGGTGRLHAVRRDLARIATTVAAFEPVIMAVHPRDARKARRMLGGEIDLFEIPVDDLWMRDAGPNFVRSEDGSLQARGLNFNGWGGKQFHRNDARVAERVAEAAGTPFRRATVVGEGGGLEVDGAGALLAAESSWVNENRNPGMDRGQVEAGLAAALGIEHFIWTPGLVGRDITDYHIDAVARIVRPGELLVELPPMGAKPDAWTRAAEAVERDLRLARDPAGKPYLVRTLRQPGRVRVDSPDFVNSYANYYVVNGGVVAAGFGDAAADEAATATLGTLYPGRRVAAIDIDALATYGGGIHCATQQQPSPIGVSKPS